MLKRLLFSVLLALSFAAQAAVFSLPWGPKPQFVDANGAPMSSGTLQFYAAGSTTPLNTYTDSTGGTPNSNPITLNTRGETPNEVWLTGGQAYKMVLKDSSGATVWTVDNIAGVNDTTGSQSEWITGPSPTYISATSFTLAGDQTTTFHKGRRIRTTNSGGTIYSTITNSVFGASTTVTVANDSGNLDSGLSAVSYGLVSAANPSISPQMVYRSGASVASAATTDIWGVAGDYIHITGTTGITSLGTAPYAGAERTIIFDGALTLTHNATSLVLPGGANITTAANDRMIVRADTTANMMVVNYVKASGAAIVSSSVAQIGGTSRKATMSVTAASATATFTADEIVVETSLGGATQVLSSYSQSINLGTTGAGGMDTGSAPVSGFVSLYAIAKADGTKSILACAVATSTGNVYGGANMPSGYTYSALIGIWPTNGSSQFVPGVIWAPQERKFQYQTFPSVFTATADKSTLTSQSISSAVPAAARTASILLGSTTTTANNKFAAASDGTGTGGKVTGFPGVSSTATVIGGTTALAGQAVFSDIPLITSQTVYVVAVSGASTNAMYVTDYGW